MSIGERTCNLLFVKRHKYFVKKFKYLREHTQMHLSFVEVIVLSVRVIILAAQQKHFRSADDLAVGLTTARRWRAVSSFIADVGQGDYKDSSFLHEHLVTLEIKLRIN